MLDESMWAGHSENGGMRTLPACGEDGNKRLLGTENRRRIFEAEGRVGDNDRKRPKEPGERLERDRKKPREA